MFPAQISFSQEFMNNQVSLFWILLQKVHLFYLKRLKRLAYYLKQVVFISHFVHELQLNADFTPVSKIPVLVIFFFFLRAKANFKKEV